PHKPRQTASWSCASLSPLPLVPGIANRVIIRDRTDARPILCEFGRGSFRNQRFFGRWRGHSSSFSPVTSWYIPNPIATAPIIAVPITGGHFPRILYVFTTILGAKKDSISPASNRQKSP